MVEITFGDDPDPPKEYVHVYQLDDGAAPQTIVTGQPDHPPVSDAADMFEVDADRLSWILTNERDATGGEPAAAVPCDECGRDIWTVRSKAASVKHGDLTMRCGGCADA